MIFFNFYKIKLDAKGCSESCIHLHIMGLGTSYLNVFKSFYFGGCTLQSHWPTSTSRFSPTWILTEEIWTWSNLLALSTTYFVFCYWGHVGMIGCRKVSVKEWKKRGNIFLCLGDKELLRWWRKVLYKRGSHCYIFCRDSTFTRNQMTQIYIKIVYQTFFFFLSKAAVGKVTMLLQSGSPSIHFYAGADIWSALITWEVFYMRLSFQAWFVKLVGY